MGRGRAILMIVAIAASLVGVGTVLGGHAIMTREMPRNYLGTRPAAAALEIAGGVDSALVERVRQHHGIAEAEAGDIVLARVKVGEDWLPLLLFVIDDFGTMRLNRFTPESGAWPPPEGTMLIERSAVPVVKATSGDALLVKTPHGRPTSVPITGLVHDPGLAPAWQEREGYGYITRRTLARLGEPPALGELRVAVSEGSGDLKAIEAKVEELGKALSAAGKSVLEVRVPPPGRHPHQSQMVAVMFLMISFSVMALVLSAILVATSMAAILGRQIREIGVMKAVGARSAQVAALYAVFVVGLGAVSVLLALPLGVMGARALAGMSARMLNLTLASQSIPWWVFAVQAAGGLVVPLTFAAIPILRASRMTVREAMDQHGVDQTTSSNARAVPSRLARGRLLANRTVLLIVRNAFRRRVRLLLTLALLSAGGAMFMTSLNIARGWERIVDRVYENRAYDVEVRVDAPASVVEELRNVPGVRRVEAWGFHRTAVWRAESVDIVRTYPDGSHGSLTMMGPPVDTSLVRFPLLAGRWLQEGDTDAVVLNHMVLPQLPGVKVGDSVALSLTGRPTRWRVVGIVEEVGSAGVAYVTRDAFARAARVGDRVQMLRIATSATSPEARTELIRALERRLEAADVSVEIVIPLALLRTAMGDHVLVLIRMLVAMAALMVTVGMLGLASTMGTSVLERTREIGIMKAVGATPSRIARLIAGEGLLMASMSWVLAFVVAVPLTRLVGQTVGMLSFRVRLPLTFDVRAVIGWLVLVVVFAALATLVPARAASRLTVRLALGRV
jgi:putative ABC transport system permease protein